MAPRLAPEIIPPSSSGPALIVGGGPAGLEAAVALGKRGVEVSLAEAGTEWGGRVTRESKLPGLATWARVRDWRLGQLTNLPNVNAFLASTMTADDILETGAEHIALATGSHWRTDGVGRFIHKPITGINQANVLSVDDMLAGRVPDAGPVVIFETDEYYMGGLLAEICISAGLDTTIVTPHTVVSRWTLNNLEQHRIQSNLLQLGVTIVTQHTLKACTADRLELACTYTGRTQQIECATLIPVTSRAPQDQLYTELKARENEWPDKGIKSVKLIGDAYAPGIIAAAVYAGHRYAREYGQVVDPDVTPFKREAIAVE